MCARRLELDGLADKLKDLHNASYKPDDSPMEKLRAGEENLVQCAARYEEDHRVQKTYEQVIRRLKQERLSFPAEQKVLEGTLKQKESEYEQLLLMSHDANLSKEARAARAPARARAGRRRRTRPLMGPALRPRRWRRPSCRSSS